MRSGSLVTCLVALLVVGSAAAQEADCNNLLDDDGDFLIDCLPALEDPDCPCGLESTTDANCFDGVDNDGDGCADGSDSDCGVVDTDADGILDDGGGNGVFGDERCLDGQTVGCDDNCPGVPNPAQADTDGDGRGDACPGTGLATLTIGGTGMGEVVGVQLELVYPSERLDIRTDEWSGLGAFNPDFTGLGLANIKDPCGYLIVVSIDADLMGEPLPADLLEFIFTYRGAPPRLDQFVIRPDTCQVVDWFGEALPGATCDITNLELSDADDDGVADGIDNCRTVPNPAQEDTDGDGTGDACEPGSDPDSDGFALGDDNCPFTTNPSQEDVDLDGVGDACEPGVRDITTLKVSKVSASELRLDWADAGDALQYNVYTDELPSLLSGDPTIMLKRKSLACGMPRTQNSLLVEVKEGGTEYFLVGVQLGDIEEYGVDSLGVPRGSTVAFFKCR